MQEYNRKIWKHTALLHIIGCNSYFATNKLYDIEQVSLPLSDICGLSFQNCV